MTSIYNKFTFSQDEINKIQPLIQNFDQYFSPSKKNLKNYIYTTDTCFILAHKMDAHLTIL